MNANFGDSGYCRRLKWRLNFIFAWKINTPVKMCKFYFLRLELLVSKIHFKNKKNGVLLPVAALK